MSLHLLTRVLRFLFMPIRCLILCPLSCLACCCACGGVEQSKSPLELLCSLLCGRAIDGIVEGHAYTVLDTAVVPARYGCDARIVKLRNPYGKKEWKGLFSDGSCAWTEEAREITGYDEDNESDDGIFWMHLSDFMSYLQVVAVCYSLPGRVRTLDKRPEGKLLGALCIDDDDVFSEDSEDGDTSPFLSPPSSWFVSTFDVTAGQGAEQAGLALVVTRPCHMFVTVDDNKQEGDGLRGMPICASGKQWALMVWDEDRNLVGKNLARDLQNQNKCMCIEELQGVDRQFTFLTSMATTQIRVPPGRYIVMIAWPKGLTKDVETHVLVHSSCPVAVEDLPSDFGSADAV